MSERPPAITASASEIVNVDALKPHPSNPRRGDVNLIAESLREHGQYRQILAQRSTGYILAGNHTYLAAKQSGMTEVAVTYVDVDDDEARRILLVDNRASDVSEYDTDALVDLLRATQDNYGDLAGTGYNDQSFADLLAALEELFDQRIQRLVDALRADEHAEVWSVGDLLDVPAGEEVDRLARGIPPPARLDDRHARLLPVMRLAGFFGLTWFHLSTIRPAKYGSGWTMTYRRGSWTSTKAAYGPG